MSTRDQLVLLRKHSGRPALDDVGVGPSLPVGASKPVRSRIAVASMEGMLVNQHLGEAERLFIYEPTGDSFQLVEERETNHASMPPGGRARAVPRSAAPPAIPTT